MSRPDSNATPSRMQVQLNTNINIHVLHIANVNRFITFLLRVPCFGDFNLAAYLGPSRCAKHDCALIIYSSGCPQQVDSYQVSIMHIKLFRKRHFFIWSRPRCLEGLVFCSIAQLCIYRICMDCDVYTGSGGVVSYNMPDNLDMVP